MTRTSDIRGRGRERQGSGGGSGTPFVKWGDDYAWLEGKVTNTWEGRYGLSATIEVTKVGGAEIRAKGRTEDGELIDERVGARSEVNVGLNFATLKDKITEDDEGAEFHIAFESWEEPKGGGDRYRIFAVVELESREETDGRGTDGSDETDDGLPF